MCVFNGCNATKTNSFYYNNRLLATFSWILILALFVSYRVRKELQSCVLEAAAIMNSDLFADPPLCFNYSLTQEVPRGISKRQLELKYDIF